MKANTIILLFSLFLSILFIVPIFYLVIGSSFFERGGTTLSFANLVSILTSPHTLVLLGNTLVFGIGSGLLAVLLGTVYAWILVRTDIPGKGILRLMPILPLTMPFIVKSFAWIYLFSPRIGLANVALRGFFGPDFVLFNIYSLPGMIFAMGVGGVPLAYLTMEPVVRSLDPSLEESSRVVGNSIIKTIRKVTLPVLMPSVLSSFLLITVSGLENFDYPFMLGGPAGIKTLATEIYYKLVLGMPPRYGEAAILSVLYLIITFTAVGLYIWETRKTNRYVVVTGKSPRPTVHTLHRWKYVGFAICFLILFFAFILPFGTLFFMSFTTYLTTIGSKVVFELTFNNYLNMSSLSLFYQALGNSLVLGLVIGLSATLIATFMAYGALKSKIRGGRVIELLSTVPLAFPGIVYGVALFWMFLMLPFVSAVLYGTLLPLVIALTFVRLPYCMRMISGGLMQISNEMEEAARVSGASWVRNFTQIILPLLKNSLVNSFVYTFVNSIRELGGVILLVTPGSIVFTVLLISYYQSHAGALNLVAAASVFLSLIIMILLALPFVIRRLLEYSKKKIKK